MVVFGPGAAAGDGEAGPGEAGAGDAGAGDGDGEGEGPGSAPATPAEATQQVRISPAATRRAALGVFELIEEQRTGANGLFRAG